MTNEECSELANSVTEKMTYMCGCRNCITTVEQIILNDRKPFDSQCNDCGLCSLPNREIRKEVSQSSNLNGWAHESAKSFCPNCGEMPLYDYWGRQKFSNYCPNCGKKMNGE